jgi:uncharacterized protein YceK
MRTLSAKGWFMKKQCFLSAMLALALVFGLVVSGCATTHSINFAEQKQPEGVYKQATISVGSSFFGKASVLQRFYEKYPSTQYEVVAIEKVRKDWMTIAGVGGGALIGTALFAANGGDADDIPFIPFFAGVGTLTGYVLQQIFGNNFVITYVERYPAALRAEG